MTRTLKVSPACNCIAAIQDEPRSRWAVPVGIVLCLSVWSAIAGLLWLFLAGA